MTRGGSGWYNIGMNKDKTQIEDVTRLAIVAKIEKKKTVKEKLDSKMESLDETEVVYRNAIAKAEARIVTLKNRIDGFEHSRTGLKEDMAKRDAELDQMNRILDQYDALMDEAVKLGEVMNAKIKEHEWYPGDPDEKRGSLDRDEEYLAARKRKLEINDWLSDALGDINRVFYSRGEVD